MSHTMTIEEAARHLAELVSGLHPGDEVTLTSNNHEIAKIVRTPDSQSRPPLRRPGAGAGLLTVISEDEDHLKDFQEYMP